MENCGGSGGRDLQEPRRPPVLDPDVPPRPSRYATRVFAILLFASIFHLSRRWRHEAGAPASSHAFTLSEIAAAISLIASLVYLFQIRFLQR